MEVDGEVPQEESFEIQSPKSKTIRVESEETQDCVRETLAISLEEAEDMGFVPSALGEPRGPTCWCDTRCSEKAIRYWHTASRVIEGGEARIVSLCKLCYNATLVRQGKQPLKLWEWKEVLEKQAHRGRLWKVPSDRT